MTVKALSGKLSCGQVLLYINILFSGLFKLFLYFNIVEHVRSCVGSRCWSASPARWGQAMVVAVKGMYSSSSNISS